LAYNECVITGDSQVYALIGCPIDYSLSPTIQNAAFKVTRINAVYVPFCVRKPYLKQAIDGLRALGVNGFNVTAPHKIDVIRFVDDLEPGAEEIGSVNTVVSKDGVLRGYNTDGIGALKTLEEAGASLDGQSLLLFGAGGAAQAIAHVFATRVNTIRIVNRTLSRAKRLERRLLKKTNVHVEIAGLSSKTIRTFVKEASIIVNASSMSHPPLRHDWLRPDQFVLDIVYKPVETKLLKLARRAGARAIDGRIMLIHQGACSFEIWTGRKAPLDAMRKAIAMKLPA